MTQNKLVTVAFILALSSACANPHKVQDLDEDKIEKKGSYMGSDIGVNEDKEAVIETAKTAESELRELGWKNSEFESKLNTQRDLLQRCRNELADPRLGGNETVTEIPEIDTMKSSTIIREQMGLTGDGNLSFKKKEMLMDRIKAEREYGSSMSAALKTIEKHRANCERDMGYARVKRGLPAQRYPAKGSYINGAYKQSRGPEKDLDDAFRIRSIEEKSNNNE